MWSEKHWHRGWISESTRGRYAGLLVLLRFAAPRLLRGYLDPVLPVRAVCSVRGLNLLLYAYYKLDGFVLADGRTCVNCVVVGPGRPNRWPSHNRRWRHCCGRWRKTRSGITCKKVSRCRSSTSASRCVVRKAHWLGPWFGLHGMHDSPLPPCTGCSQRAEHTAHTWLGLLFAVASTQNMGACTHARTHTLLPRCDGCIGTVPLFPRCWLTDQAAQHAL